MIMPTTIHSDWSGGRFRVHQGRNGREIGGGGRLGILTGVRIGFTRYNGNME